MVSSQLDNLHGYESVVLSPWSVAMELRTTDYGLRTPLAWTLS